MLKTFIKGLVFGTGFTIAMIAVSLLFGVGWVQWNGGEAMLVDRSYQDAGPEFSNPQEAEIQPKRDGAADGKPDYSFFNRSEPYGGTPIGGGILGMSVLPTPPDATRPRTYQVWLTETAMWKIRTEETTVEVETVTYPTVNGQEPSVVVFQHLRGSGGGSSTTISASTIAMLKRGEECEDDDHLNGELRITTDGVVFLLPDAIKR